MGIINKFLIHLNLKNIKKIFQGPSGVKIDFGMKVKAISGIPENKKINSSYYGRSYAYDWENSKFENSNWRKRWIG